MSSNSNNYQKFFLVQSWEGRIFVIDKAVRDFNKEYWLTWCRCLLYAFRSFNNKFSFVFTLLNFFNEHFSCLFLCVWFLQIPYRSYRQHYVSFCDLIVSLRLSTYIHSYWHRKLFSRVEHIWWYVYFDGNLLMKFYHSSVEHSLISSCDLWVMYQ